jgi:hypothetical protein
MDDWMFREKIKKFIKSWPIMVFVFIGTALIAGLLAHFFPPVQWAVAELYIGIDMTRVYDVASLAAYAKTEPFNIDDYKNWQMTQASVIAKSEEIAVQTLTEVRSLDPYWDDITVSEFKRMQEIDWYDVGLWRMRIRAKEAESALQAVDVWRDIALDELSKLIKESEDVLVYEGRLRAADELIVSAELRLTQLEELSELIGDVLMQFNEFDPAQTVLGSDRDDLWELVSLYAADTPLWDKTLTDLPLAGEVPAAYITWLEEVEDLIAVEGDHLNQSIVELEEGQDNLREDYLREISEAKGLSASLYVEEHYSDPFLESNYLDSTVGIVAGFVGLLAYIIIWIMISETKVEKE